MSGDEPSIIDIINERLDLHSQRIEKLENLFENLLDIQGIDAEIQIDIGDPMENTFRIRVRNIVFYSNGREYRSPIQFEKHQVAHHERRV